MIDFDIKELKEIIATSADGFNIFFKGICGSAQVFPLAALAKAEKPQKHHKIHIYIQDDAMEASFAVSDLTMLLGEKNVFYFPNTYRGVGMAKRADESYQVQRTAAIEALAQWNHKQDDLILVTYPTALEEGLPDKNSLSKEQLSLSVGDKLSHEFIKECLFAAQFKRVDFVSEPGQYALRGSIIDVFSYTENQPYRINFFGDDIESIRLFDPNTQRSVEERQNIRIVSSLQGTVSIWDWVGQDVIVWEHNTAYTLSHRPDFEHFPYATDYTITYNTAPQPSFNKNFELLAQDILSKKRLGYSVHILSDNPAQVHRLDDIFESLGHRKPFVDYIPFSLHEGFVEHTQKVCLYTDHQLFGRIHRVTLKRAVQKSEQLTINDLSGFRIGDYVVHIDHGVGVFGGLVKTQINGKPQEVIKLIYKDNDVLFVSIHGLHRISRYKSKDSVAPKIYKLGTGAWERLKQQTKKKVKDIAQDLIRLYAQRKATEGFAFSPDTYMQHELEASFLFEDTPDQLRATQEVKHDMEQTYPMDRLICGDVGFGKTEVAIRAAFKAVADGKQVAVLVPTTILALQHYQTFKERLSDFSTNIQFVSRLKTNPQVKEIIAQLAAGKIDILIGTHRILNADMKFKDLGLLIIDEEQKFGVAAKEKLRQMKLNVDTLTMTATPIPRTLQFSLMGARDLSIIQTPPSNRLPIQTELSQFDEVLIRDAINQELERGGQIFFVHNRVQDIQEMAEKLARIYPGLRIAIGHGQMPPAALEKVLLDFICGDYDLLLATSIIENGVDIPNANTIIINRAHTFGLSDLHQMRGRVGRSNRKAYCYLLIPPEGALSDDAKRRLKAIEAFTELGSGFNIAMQDLDIRGAGNLLGGEQSGFVAEMGFEAYQRILEEAFAELNATSTEGSTTDSTSTEYLTDSTIDTDLEVLIPDDYIPQVPEKIRLYKELDSIKDEAQLERYFASLQDRFGPIPESLRQLGYVVRLRRLAVRLGFERIVLKNGIMLAYFIHNQQSAYYKTPLFAGILESISKRPGYFQVKEQGEKLFVRVKEVTSVEAAYNFLNYFIVKR